MFLCKPIKIMVEETNPRVCVFVNMCNFCNVWLYSTQLSISIRDHSTIIP